MEKGTREKLQALVNGLDREGLRELFAMAKQRSTDIERQGVFEFKPGDKVSFTGRYNKVETGVVEKVNYTRVSVKVGVVGWSVAPSLLTKI